MNTYTFKIDHITVSFPSSIDFAHDYDYLSATTIHRTMNGRGVLQGTWTKMVVTISGTGLFPAGLSHLNPYTPHTLHCGVPLSVSSPKTVTVLPTARRTDPGYEVVAHAVLADGMLQATTVSVAGNKATAAPVAGAITYRFDYYPKLDVYIKMPKENTLLRSARFGWTLICEEI